MIDAPLILLPHNNDETIKQRLSWKTDILTAIDGTEQRRRERANPLERLSYHLTHTDAAEESTLQGMIWNSVDLRIGVPRWQDVVAIALPGALAGDGTITATDDVSLRFVPGPAVVWLEGVGYEEVDITDATGAVLTLAAPLIDAWPAGAMVLPISIGYVAAPIEGETFGQLKGHTLLVVDVASDMAGITDGGESLPMIPASISVNPEGVGSEGSIALGDVQAVIIDVYDAENNRIPYPEIEITYAGSAMRVYWTGQTGLYNILNISGGGSESFDVTSGPVTVTASVILA